MLDSLFAFFGHVPTVIVALAGTAVGSFAVLVILDNVFGIVLAIKQRTFDPHKLTSFIESQFGTKQAGVLAGEILVAVLTGQQPSIQAAALAIVTASGGAMAASVLADITSKLTALVGFPAQSAPVAPAPAAPANPA